jgi:hypothetical protein
VSIHALAIIAALDAQLVVERQGFEVSIHALATVADDLARGRARGSS